MKFAILMLSLVLSTNGFAFSSVLISEATSFSGMGEEFEKVQADLVIKDSQQMLHNDVISLFLSQKIQEIQILNEDFSEAEALDFLIESAQSILAK